MSPVQNSGNIGFYGFCKQNATELGVSILAHMHRRVWTTISDYFGGYVFWWYNLSFALFGFTILGLVLLVREGIMAYNNAQAFGLRPKRDKYVEATAPEDDDLGALSIGETEADNEASQLQGNDDSRG